MLVEERLVSVRAGSVCPHSRVRNSKGILRRIVELKEPNRMCDAGDEIGERHTITKVPKCTTNEHRSPYELLYGGHSSCTETPHGRLTFERKQDTAVCGYLFSKP